MNPSPQLWRCPNCGQVHFGDVLPDMCDFCHDFTTWQAIHVDEAGEIQHREDAPQTSEESSQPRQMPLF